MTAVTQKYLVFIFEEIDESWNVTGHALDTREEADAEIAHLRGEYPNHKFRMSLDITSRTWLDA